jgi:hypothetical protein
VTGRQPGRAPSLMARARHRRPHERACKNEAAAAIFVPRVAPSRLLATLNPRHVALRQYRTRQPLTGIVAGLMNTAVSEAKRVANQIQDESASADDAR